MRIRSVIFFSISIPIAGVSACSSSSAPDAEPVGTTRAALTGPPPFAGTFINPVTMMGGACDSEGHCCDSEVHCEDLAGTYYKALELRYPPQTFSGWKALFGLSDDPSALASGEVRAVYYNNGDLQFGRDMHCRVAILNPLNPPAIACYVSNYDADGSGNAGTDPHGAIARAYANVGRLASVAMVYDPGYPDHQVQFWVFGAQGDGGDPNDGLTIPAATLDSQGAKATPGVCLACHGGQYDSSQQLVLNGNFLPFDAPSFVFASSPANLTEPAQREAIGVLNDMVLATASTTTLPGQATSELINGWYAWCGGAGAAGCYIDDAGHPFEPFSWILGSLNPPTAMGLYPRVPRRYCRTCHIGQAQTYNFEDYGVWSSNSQRIGNAVLQNPAHMPFAEVPYKAFWSDSVAQNALELYVNQCPNSEQFCSGVCVDTSTDANNCGVCGNVCPSGVCSGGACTCVPRKCPAGNAGDSCSSTYPNGCGGTISCSGDCKNGTTCQSGTCTPPPRDCTTTGCVSGRVCCDCLGAPACLTALQCKKSCSL